MFVFVLKRKLKKRMEIMDFGKEKELVCGWFCEMGKKERNG